MQGLREKTVCREELIITVVCYCAYVHVLSILCMRDIVISNAFVWQREWLVQCCTYMRVAEGGLLLDQVRMHRCAAILYSSVTTSTEEYTLQVISLQSSYM